MKDISLHFLWKILYVSHEIYMKIEKYSQMWFVMHDPNLDTVMILCYILGAIFNRLEIRDQIQ